MLELKIHKFSGEGDCYLATIIQFECKIPAFVYETKDNTCWTLFVQTKSDGDHFTLENRNGEWVVKNSIFPVEISQNLALCKDPASLPFKGNSTVARTKEETKIHHVSSSSKTPQHSASRKRRLAKSKFRAIRRKSNKEKLC